MKVVQVWRHDEPDTYDLMYGPLELEAGFSPEVESETSDDCTTALTVKYKGGVTEIFLEDSEVDLLLKRLFVIRKCLQFEFKDDGSNESEYGKLLDELNDIPVVRGEEYSEPIQKVGRTGG